MLSTVMVRRSLATVAAVGAVVATAGPARATHITYYNSVQNLATGFCLDSNYEGRVYTLGCNGGNYQKWRAVATSNGYELRNGQTNRCLDSNYEGAVYTLPCNGGNYQKWTFPTTELGSSIRYVKNVQTRRVLDSNAAKQVYILPINYGSYQKWRFR